ncbi:TPA: conjugal transfer protein TraD [Legionella pneumophila]|uniref:conjugal transfer protein TraD n=1 Tax=Legionella pneumophila TaxID=446 RepID=UPI001A27F8A0|nr:conjugal transfer protein TraD [Legionella pneumophila]MCH9086360.1 conjugal transfer protein TraD [Legionella pneumophila serogroup 1]MCH9197543.1 conjugal transfer protein TraD [Legionella pneumophila serogroup 1]MDW9175579.1 conjugal transfer protein TraD [Legionella pneumophila]HAT3883269.1 conjugal transfer protein TraD [Legionella pneumophila]HAU1108899.1 conjugal transfer protein TraD [Legionella pneumophila]
MTIHKQIEKEKQLIARCEKSLALDKLKRHKADARRKIELGGLVIKSGLDTYNKAIILGGLNYISEIANKDSNYLNLFEDRGKRLFSE